MSTLKAHKVIEYRGKPSYPLCSTCLRVGPEEGRHMPHRDQNGSKRRCQIKEACLSV